MTADLDRARTLRHYSAILDELEHPTAHRLTIEVFALDPGTDLEECSFTITKDEGRYTRIVTAGAKSRPRMVGLWRIVPEDQERAPIFADADFLTRNSCEPDCDHRHA